MKAWAAALVLALACPGAALADASLIAAVKARNSDAALELIGKRGTDVNATEPDGSTALLWAAHYEDAAVLERLIRAGADVNAANDYGMAPLQVAAAAGNAEIIGLLLDAGADVEARNPEGQTALMAVARTGRLEAARRLIAAGADVNAREAWGGQTALMWAAAQHQPQMVRLLIEAGADVDAQATIRDWERLLTSEPRIKEMYFGGMTALLYAAREGCLPCARELGEAGADLDKGDAHNVTPLIIALLNFRFDTAAYLVEAGADPNRWDWWGRTPLYAVADMNVTPQGMRADLPSLDSTRGIEVARMLLERGADPDLRLKNVPPPRNIAFDRGVDDGVLNTGATPLLRAAYGGDLEMLELLLEYGARLDIPNRYGVRPVFAAAGPGGTRGALKTEADIVSALDLLLDAGASIDERGQGGQTALHAAVRLSMKEVVRYLADRGADLYARDARGLQPMDYATGGADSVSFGNFDVVGELPEMVALLEELMAEQSGTPAPAAPAREEAGVAEETGAQL